MNEYGHVLLVWGLAFIMAALWLSACRRNQKLMDEELRNIFLRRKGGDE
jgi:hypothetical protein